jgi:hypothetical protein
VAGPPRPDGAFEIASSSDTRTTVSSARKDINSSPASAWRSAGSFAMALATSDDSPGGKVRSCASTGAGSTDIT